MTNPKLPNLIGYQAGVAAITAARAGTEPRAVLETLLADHDDPAERAVVAEAAAELAVSVAVCAMSMMPTDDADAVLRHMGEAIAADLHNPTPEQTEEGEHDHDR